METVLFAIFSAVCALCAAIAFVRVAHMFQLNSYGAATHLKWTAHNIPSAVPNILSLILAAVCFAADAVRDIESAASTVLHIIVICATVVFALANSAGVYRPR